MDGNSSTGNLNSASPRTLPVDALQQSDLILIPKEAGGLSLEPLALLTSQDHQIFPGNFQDPVKNLQKATDNLLEPVENVLKPLESPQKLTECVRKPSISLQEPAENFQKQSGSFQEPSESLHPLSGSSQEPEKSCQEPLENIHEGLDMDQKSPEILQCPEGETEEEQPIFPLDLHHPPRKKPEPGTSAPPLGPDSTSQEPSMTEDQNVEVLALPSGPGYQHPPGDLTKLQRPGVSPVLNPPGDPAELDPCGDPLEFRPGDHTGRHPLKDSAPTGNNHQNLSDGLSSAPQQAPAHLAPPSGDSRLCGFLLKLGGPLKNWKQRWFCYEEQKNQLLYYRRPQDLTPLGQVGLSGATFSPLLDIHSSSSFQIHTPQRTFTLKVGGPHLVPGGPSPRFPLNHNLCVTHSG